MDFQNKFTLSRSGFSHTSTLFHNGQSLATAKRHYLNRTWESYTYQSSMKDAVDKAIENTILAEKISRGMKRLTKEKREEVLTVPLIVELVEFRKTL